MKQMLADIAQSSVTPRETPDSVTWALTVLAQRAQAKRAAQELGTDGDMAAVGVIAHEMGHAVALQLGFASPRTYENEAVADCLAGVWGYHAELERAMIVGPPTDEMRTP